MSQRLALLSEQLAASRDEPVGEPEPLAVGDEWWGEHTRVALRPALRVVPEPELPIGPVGEPVVVPTPGRHADRRALGWAVLLPETLRGRVALGPGPLAVVAVGVALALAWTCWQVVRDDPPAAVPVAAADRAGEPGDLVPVVSSPPAAAAPPAGAAAPTTVTVDVAGRVRRPGIVVLEAGARVVDALEEAGGARPAVDLTTLNLARPLVDGEQILVGVPGAASAVPPTSPAPDGAAPVALVDLNLADAVQLEALPEVGPVTAASIVAWRDEHGGFSAVTELLEVDGIGDATHALLPIDSAM